MLGNIGLEARARVLPNQRLVGKKKFPLEMHSTDG
jgi:hypothetical protein